MFNLLDTLVRATGAASVGGALGASIGGSVAAVFGPLSVSGAAVGGLIGSTVSAAASVCSDLVG